MTEFFDRETRPIPRKVKAALGQGRRFGWIRFRRPEYGETVHVSEMDVESGALCRRFLRPAKLNGWR
jgi:hypothetical protein